MLALVPGAPAAWRGAPVVVVYGTDSAALPPSSNFSPSLRAARARPNCRRRRAAQRELASAGARRWARSASCLRCSARAARSTRPRARALTTRAAPLASARSRRSASCNRSYTQPLRSPARMANNDRPRGMRGQTLVIILPLGGSSIERSPTSFFSPSRKLPHAICFLHMHRTHPGCGPCSSTQDEKSYSNWLSHSAVHGRMGLSIYRNAPLLLYR
jgi:hypothetical protein